MMSKHFALRMAWSLLLGALSVWNGKAQDWLVYDITPAVGSAVVLDPMSSTIGIQVRVCFATTPPDSIPIFLLSAKSAVRDRGRSRIAGWAEK